MSPIPPTSVLEQLRLAWLTCPSILAQMLKAQGVCEPTAAWTSGID